ncbi:MAG: HAD family phosphatase [Calditrichaeota bacterium]|nr:HAD family phosphatase [Calditrichota bacterium]
MGFRGIIFDFNGVLVWDTPLHHAAWQEMARRLRGQPFSEAELENYVNGRTNSDINSYLLGRAVGEEELAGLVKEKENIYLDMCRDLGKDFTLSPGAQDLFDELIRRNIPFTIATSSEIGNLSFYREHFALDRWFAWEKVVYDDGSMAGKPAPDFYLEAARRLGLSPADCVVVEDAPSGIEAARAAGIGHIVGLGPAEGHAQLLALAGVKQAVASLREIDSGKLLKTGGGEKKIL